MKTKRLDRGIFSAAGPVLILTAMLLGAALSGCKDEPQPVPPTVETVSAVTEITTTTAVAGGEVVLDGEMSITARGVCWGTSPEPTTAGERTLDGRGVGKFTSRLSGLAPATTYYLRAYAINNAGTGYGNEITFTTLGGEAAVTTADVSLITPTSARCGGNVTGDGGAEIAERGICWGTQQSPTADMNKATSGKGTGEFTAKLSGLTPATAYYVRAYAINAMGTVYGNEVTFTTLSGESNIATAAAADITATTALSGGSVGDEGGLPVIAKGVCWGTSPSPTIEGGKTTDGSGTGEFESRIAGLAPATTYYLRAYATNALGTRYGNEVTFTTLSGAANITTAAVDNITMYSARSGGNVTGDGGSPIIVKGVCWGTSQNPTIDNEKAVNGPGTGEFLNDLTELAPGTAYYARAYATNELGDTYYGNEVSFTTIDPFMNLTPGTLQSVVEEYGLEEITSLALSGVIDQRDFAYMKNMVDNHSLKEIDLSGVTVAAYKEYPENEIPASAFDGSSKLASFVYPADITSIGERAFSLCSGLTGSLIMGNSVTSIGDMAFFYCFGFTGSLVIPDSVVSIGHSAFNGCMGFDGSLTIGDGVTSIRSGAFDGCSGFTGSLTIPDSVISIGNYAFGECTGFDGSLTIGRKVETIGYDTFNGCSGITGSLAIPDSVISIGNSAFYKCTGFTGSLTIGNGVTSIGSGAFNGCTGFTGSLTIGNGVTSIMRDAFNGCSGFTGSLAIPDSVVSIGHSAFNGCMGFDGSLAIPDSVISIGDSAFYKCTGFDGSLTIGDGVISIGSDAFFFCTGFTGTLKIGSKVETIGHDAFLGCVGLTGSLTIPDSVISLGDGAFLGCIGLTGSLTIGDGVASIGTKTFSDCTGFTGSLVIPDNITSIGSSAFYDCSGFTGTLTIGRKVETIGNDAFLGCIGLTGSLAIPDSTVSIGDYAFFGCTGFDGSLTIGGGVASIGSGAFSDCTGFTGSLAIPGAASIGSSAFSGCTGFNGSLTFGSGVQAIGAVAFMDCSGFTGSLSIPDSVMSIEDMAFYNCDGLNDIKVAWMAPITYKGDMLPLGKTVYVPAASVPLYEKASGWQSHPIAGY